jgi:hypothetical protein
MLKICEHSEIWNSSLAVGCDEGCEDGCVEG